MSDLPGQRYGEPDQGNAFANAWELYFANPARPGAVRPRLTLSSSSYEEQRLCQYKPIHSATTFERTWGWSEDLCNMTDVVKVIVGPEQKATWVLHEALLTSVSEFARAALSHPCMEKEERVIRLPEEDPTTFGNFVRFLYTKVIWDSPRTGLVLDRVLALYMLSDRLQVQSLCKQIFSDLFFRVDLLNASQVLYVLENTAPPDPLRYACLERTVRAIQSKSPFLISPVAADLCRDHGSEILAVTMGKYKEVILAPPSETGQEVRVEETDPEPAVEADQEPGGVHINGGT
ncbi:hypothetical protein HRR83_002876 [Exophiala dermatitidis]|uniref:BTB domain-containing protein n=2 Tax=Exophiala dermatitidis TaxID=5970 RepID=H6C1A9_EXODN|nr:uncharacterized protein HMPREF1120_05431 [Exophiala dermatitidis NIH/UT8656]KAJ4516720.1 hypothetical protein HRR75_003380 [Exophiala dermatitidis]EHY57392.1 hypothetical protein HMPREF1120_05431 [Exophiala dermatitidis NIH/UT8656]KAJ4520692.1 hypothetical protein HRR74_003693 [Exophiala dermatitidis]KAJ4521834.1 hypothetical protein HRR73_003033 [Exophiala dermatitidis]KAJ4537663.1 hypothetical protein HRR76_005653 [Exophiala dermatitidis]